MPQPSIKIKMFHLTRWGKTKKVLFLLKVMQCLSRNKTKNHTCKTILSATMQQRLPERPTQRGRILLFPSLTLSPCSHPFLSHCVPISLSLCSHPSLSLAVFPSLSHCIPIPLSLCSHLSLSLSLSPCSHPSLSLC